MEEKKGVDCFNKSRMEIFQVSSDNGCMLAVCCVGETHHVCVCAVLCSCDTVCVCVLCCVVVTPCVCVCCVV